MTDQLLAPAFTNELAPHFRGDLLQPDQDGYDDARKVWNGLFDRRPALIARCAGPSDVIAAVRFARETALPVAVRGGGHSAHGPVLGPANMFRLNANVRPSATVTGPAA